MLKPSQFMSQIGDSLQRQLKSDYNPTEGALDRLGSGSAGDVNRWIGEGYWMSVYIREGRELGVYDVDTQSSDPYVKVSVSAQGDSGASMKKFCTRTLHRNLSPLFNERVVFSLADLSPSHILQLDMYDADFMVDEFMGRIKCKLGSLLGAITSPNEPLVQWFTLYAKSRHSLRAPEGELLLEIQLMKKDDALQVSRLEEPYTSIAGLLSRFSGKAVEVELKTIRTLRRLRNADVASFIPKLSLEIRVGQALAKRPVKNFKFLSGQRGEAPLELEISEKICIPLGPAFRQASDFAITRASLLRTESVGKMVDINIFLCIGSEQICKAQVPLWSIPDHVELSAAASERAGEDSTPAAVFLRTMEPYVRRISLAVCEVEMAAKIVKWEEANAVEDLRAGSTIIRLEEDPEDNRESPPIENVPAPLDDNIVETQLPCGPSKLYQLICKPDGAVAQRMNTLEGLTNVTFGEWDGVGKESPERTVEYVKPLTIPIPFSPKQADCKEVQKLLIKEPSGWVMESQITTSAPKGENFRVLNQVVALRGSSAGRCTLRVTMKVEFLKSVGMLKGAITNGALADTKKHWAQVVEVASAYVASSETGTTLSKPAATPTSDFLKPTEAQVMPQALLVWMPFASAGLFLLTLIMWIALYWKYSKPCACS